MNHLCAKKNPPIASLPGFEHINRFWDNSRDTYVAKILPGEFYVTTQHELIATTLGSCVSACIRDKLLGIGGMNHFMLPSHDNIDHLALGNSAARYGSFAMEQLINEILKLGAHRDRLEIKVAGGGHVIKNMGNIGEQNIAFVKQFLTLEGLSWCAEDLGGKHPRKVLYNPKNGNLKIKKLQQLSNDTLYRREREYEKAIKEQPQGEIELF